MAKPTVSLAPLKYPDGSASYISPTGDAILASVNGPIEVTRRDTQKPEEATLEVIVKPGVGASGVGERYVEGMLRGVLSRVILMRDRNMARKGVVVTLVVMGTKVREERGGSYLPILPSLLNAALMALLSAAIPMSMVYASTVVAVSPSGDLIQNASVKDIKTATSMHVLSFSSKGHLLLNESDGTFDMDTWEKVYDLAKSVCLNSEEGTATGQDVDMGSAAGTKASAEPLEQTVRDAIEDRLREDCAWKLLGA